MTVREVKKQSAAPILKCVSCLVSEIQIGARDDWMPVLGGHACSKDACRDALGLPRYVPPDERR